MIQRIQSIFLLVAIAFQVWLLKVNFYNAMVNSNDVYYSIWQSINMVSNEIHTNLIHIALQFILIGLTLVTLFNFKNRKQQMKFCLYLILGTILSFVFCLYNLYTTNYSEYHFSFGTYLISLVVILYISAYFFIKKDDELVKSADRLRE